MNKLTHTSSSCSVRSEGPWDIDIQRHTVPTPMQVATGQHTTAVVQSLSQHTAVVVQWLSHNTLPWWCSGSATPHNAVVVQWFSHNTQCSGGVVVQP